MRLALISDIHGNLIALNAALQQIDRAEADQIVCLGDIAASGPQPTETLERLQRLDVPVVMGNTDAWLLDLPTTSSKYEGDDGRKFWDIDAWTSEQLTEKHRAYIRTFDPTVSLDLGHGVELLAYHGSPRSFDDMILPTTLDEGLALFFEGASASLLAGGHTHIAMARPWKTAVLVNPGSVGQPYIELPETGELLNPPWAEYAIIEVSDVGLQIELRRAAVEVEEVIAAALESDMPHADWWAKDWTLA